MLYLAQTEEPARTLQPPPEPPVTPQQFIARWQAVTLNERAACQSHFLDLCALLGVPGPVAADPTGEWFAFEKGVVTTDGTRGFADVWRKGRFGWEYKKRHAKLALAYDQLLRYREALQNPPLLIVCDMDRFQVHTNWPNTVKAVHEFALADLADPKHLNVLRSAFLSPEDLNPGRTREQVTLEIAARFARLADALRGRGEPPERAARFLLKVMFCMFAQCTDLLPGNLFTTLLAKSDGNPGGLARRLGALFAAMCEGGHFGADEIPWFNGGLFRDADVPDVTADEVRELNALSLYDWGQVEPSVFGTLFERTLDPGKRAQIGAHYTSRADIEALLQPVLVDPLRREWDAARAEADRLWAALQDANARDGRRSAATKRARQAFDSRVQQFLARLTAVTVLDPACGSGNFLYLALHALLDLEKEVWAYAAAHDLPYTPLVNPRQLRGLEVNAYARELAQVVIWIGYLQWHKFNGFRGPDAPVLDPMESIERRDAILDLSAPAAPKEPDWPDAEFVVGNPPFLGTKKLRAELGDQYVKGLFRLYRSRLPNFSDLCCYWFEKARAMVHAGRARRVGLIATQGIRGGGSRTVLERIKKTGDIFFAVGDRNWVLDGAAVHISMVGFDDGTEQRRALDGRTVTTINANLTSAADVTRAKRLPRNAGVGYIADVKGGRFDLSPGEALPILALANSSGRPNSDVLRPWVNGRDVTARSRDWWIIDFGTDATLEEASLYETPLALVADRVRPEREASRNKSWKAWWLHTRPCPDMRRAIEPHGRYLATSIVSKHRLFSWLPPAILPDHQLAVFGRGDDYFMGVLQSRVHELWSLTPGIGTQVRERESGFRYTPTTCFEQFPFPEPFAALEAQIAEAARDLDAARAAWLNPPEWTRTEVLEFPGSVGGPWARYIAAEDLGPGLGTVRYPRVVPRDAECAAKLKARTLTNLYNARPDWLADAHRRLDELVLAAYGWPADLGDDDLLARLLELNLAGRSGLRPEPVAEGEGATGRRPGQAG
jgi:hypothetical protein